MGDAKIVRAAIERLAALDTEVALDDLATKWTAKNPDVTDTILHGKKAALASMVSDYQKVFDDHSAVWAQIRQYAKGYRSNLIDE
jgi:hypothetical protein